MTLGRLMGIAGLTVTAVVSLVWLSRDHATPVSPPTPATSQLAATDEAARPAAPSTPTPPSPAAPAAIPAPAADSPAGRDDTHDALTPIRAAVRRDPRRALALIAVEERAHPDGPLAEERLALKVDALVYADQIGEARDAAEDYLRRHPSGSHAEHIEVLTGVHPPPPDSP